MWLELEAKKCLCILEIFLNPLSFFWQYLWGKLGQFGEGRGGGEASLDETLKIASKLSIERQEAGSEVCTLFSSSTL